MKERKGDGFFGPIKREAECLNDLWNACFGFADWAILAGSCKSSVGARLLEARLDRWRKDA